jgi:L-rhamnose mutarotase
VTTVLGPEIRKFVLHHMDVEAVLQRCGLRTYDLVFIDGDGNWTRWVFPSDEAAAAAADMLGVPLHRGWDERMSRRMNKRDHWNEPGGQRRAL